jgi:GNAT superfamily N-acetyltransferase
MSVAYRMAQAGDLPALAQLRWEMEVEELELEGKHATMDLNTYMRQFVVAVGDDVERGTHVSWLAEDGNKPVACVALNWWNLAPNFADAHRKRGVVSYVYTRPSYRRHGISRAQAISVVISAREHNLHRLVLWASAEGRPLYEDLGFAPSRGLELNL